MNGRIQTRIPRFQSVKELEPEPLCGTPVDTSFFDDSRITETPGPGSEVALARFELPMHYCGLFENFSQFIGDANSEPLEFIATPGLEWRLLINKRPLYPYLRLEHIVNPWGFSCCPVAIRLDENATVEFVVRNAGRNNGQAKPILTVGGRITGRFWYNAAYGDATPRGGRFS